MEENNNSNLRIGLFGGTFNPIHLGHLRAAEEIRERFNLSKVIFIPAHIPPHKKIYISSNHRLNMTDMAIKENIFFELSDVETDRQGNSYSFETIEYFKDYFNNNADLFFIIGEDAFLEIHLWKNYPHFFSSCNFIVMSRPCTNRLMENNIIPRDINKDFEYNQTNKSFVHRSGYYIHFCKIALMEISSTEIRQKLSNQHSIRYLVPDSVERYIHDKKIY